MLIKYDNVLGIAVTLITVLAIYGCNEDPAEPENPEKGINSNGMLITY